MSRSTAERRARCIAHLVGSLPLPDSETAFRTVSAALGPYLARLPDGETGIRKSWIRFLQDVLAAHPAIDVAAELPPFRFVQFDGKLVREIPRLRTVPGAALDPAGFHTGYADMAIRSWRVFETLQRTGTIPPGVRFQISLPTPTAPTYNNMVPDDRPAVLAALTAHLVHEVEALAAALPHERIAVQWDVCQEVLAWEGYYEPGPVDFHTETLDVLAAVGDAVPAEIELGYHLCYGSPAGEHIVQPRDSAVMVKMINAIVARVARPIAYFHVPVPQARVDDGYFAPLAGLALDMDTDFYLGLIHYADAAGDTARLAAARKVTRVDGVAAECGMARGDPARLEALLAAHAAAARYASPASGQLHERSAVRDAERSTDDVQTNNVSDDEPQRDEAAEPADAPETLSPSVRRLVKQYDLDVTGLRGTGPDGRLRLGDVMALIGGREGRADDDASPRSREPRPGEPGHEPEPIGDELGMREHEIGSPTTRARARAREHEIKPAAVPTAAHEQEAESNTSPVAALVATPEPDAGTVTTTVFECDAGRILEDRRRRREHGREIALSAYFVAAFARALSETQALAAETGHGIPLLALESPRGADGAHVLSGADALTLEQISVALSAPAVQPARPCVLIRHHGLGGSLLAQSSRLAREHTAVLGIGRIRRQIVVRVIDGEEVPRIASQCLLTLAFDANRLGLGAADGLLGRCVMHIERWRVADAAADR